MKKHRKERNWSLYNQKLKKIARIDFFISEEAIQNWHYKGPRQWGGKLLYSDISVELCLLMREFYQLPYRQTQGFVESIFKTLNFNLAIPDYTTICRRSSKLVLSLTNKDLLKKPKEHMIVAVDSTGLSLHSATEWNRMKYQKNKLPGYERWRKLHIIIDVNTGEILANQYTRSTDNDGPELPMMLDSIKGKVGAVCGDMAYDTVRCREAIRRLNARQLIPPIRRARVSKNNRNIKKHKETLYERDEAIRYIENNTINGDQSGARKSWKEKSGYHARSLVETTMWQIKSHCSDRLTNKREDSRATQATIKCKVINLISAAA